MRGAQIEAGRIHYRTDLPEVAAAPGETTIAVLTAGVCATDIALMGGYMGFSGVPGHEFVGVALDGPLTGSRVVGGINAACGQCAWCARGEDRHCPSRTVLGILGRPGAFAERLCLPTRNLRVVPDSVTDDEASFAEPLAAALAIGEAVDCAGADALVVGDGRLGLLCAWALHLLGASVTLSGRHPERVGLHPPGTLAEGALQVGTRHDVVVEASGNPALLELAIGRTRPRGTLVLKTTTERAEPVNLWQVVVDEIRLVGSRCGRIQPAMDVLEAGSIPVAEWVTDRFPLEEIAGALGRASERSALKVLVDVAGRGRESSDSS